MNDADPRMTRVGLDQDQNSTRRPVPSETALADGGVTLGSHVASLGPSFSLEEDHSVLFAPASPVANLKCTPD